MGINIMLSRRTGGFVSGELGWDDSRYSGDRDFGAMLGLELPCQRIGDGIYEDILERPADFAEWRRAIGAREWPNHGRFEMLIDILEKNPDVWIYVSY